MQQVGSVGQDLEVTSAKMIRSYPQLAREVVSMISSASKEIYLASRYYEASIGSRLLAKFSEGVILHILDGNSSGISFEERIREASKFDTKNRSLMLQLLESPNVRIGSCKLDYSFLVVDRRFCGFEVTNPANPDEFNFGVKLEDSEIAKSLIVTFQNLMGSSAPLEECEAPTDELF